MKILLSTLLILLSTSAMALPDNFTGSWFDPEQPGFGINVDPNSGDTVAYFYSHDHYNRPIWWVMVGDEVLTMSVTYVIENGPPKILKEIDVGVAEIIPLAHGIIRFRYTLIAEVDPYTGDLSLCDGPHCDGDYIFQQGTQPVVCE